MLKKTPNQQINETLLGNTEKKVCLVKVSCIVGMISFSLFVCPPPKNKPILILLYVFSQFIFSFFISFWEAKYFLFLSFTAIPFVVCPFLLLYLLMPKNYWLTLWFFPIFFSCFSFLISSFVSFTLSCLAVSSCPLFSNWDSSHSWSLL